MQTFNVLHSLLRWAVLIFGVLTVINAASGYFKKRPFTNSDDKSNLFFMISCDVQLLIGLILYFGNGWLDKLKHFSEYKSDPTIRFYAMEHTSVMLLAWVLVHIGRASVKRADNDRAKHKKMLWFFGIALLLILVSIPWPFRQVGRPYFQWFS